MSRESPAAPQVQLIGFLFNYPTTTYQHSSSSRTHSPFFSLFTLSTILDVYPLTFSHAYIYFFKFCNKFQAVIKAKTGLPPPKELE